ncbi:MAG: ABC transporter permease [Syntrophomonadaceae bacterium]|nr:ABC transporter permease [Syntrophomonadaceae bacterium]
MNLYGFETQRLLKGLLTWSAVVNLLLVLFMAFYPSMAESGLADLSKYKLEALPPAVLEAFGLNLMTDLSDLLQYYAYIAQYILMAAAIYALILGTSALIKEEADGTIEFLYARPVSRLEITTGKLLSIVTVLWAFNLITFGVSVLLLHAFRDPGYEYLPLTLAMFSGMLAAQMVFLAAGFALSTVLPRYSNPVTVGLGLFLVTYLLGTIAAVNEQLEWLKYLSPYHYVQPTNVLANDGTVEQVYLHIMLLTTLTAILFAYWRYRRKDLLV